MGKYVIFAEFGGDELYTPRRSRSLFMTGLNEGLKITIDTINVINYNTTNTITGNVLTRLNEVVSGKTVHLHILQPSNDEIILDATTDSSGVFSFSFTAGQRGEYTFTAVTDADDLYSKSSSDELKVLTNTLNVNMNLVCDVEEQIVDNPVNLSCTVKDSSNSSVAGLSVKFYNGSTLLGTGVTNTSGVATLKPVLSVVGTNTIHCTSDADTKYNSGSSGNVSVNVIKHTLSVDLDSETIYKGWIGKLRVTDETGEGVSGISFLVTVNNVNHTILSDAGGYLNLQTFTNAGNYSISVSSTTLSKYNAFSSSYVLKVSDTLSVKNSPMTASNVETKIPYKTWSNLENMSISTGDLYTSCGLKCFNDTIAGKNGSRNTPASLKFSNLGFSIPDGALLESVKVYMKIRTLSCSSDSANINIGAPRLQIGNSNVLFQLPSGSKLPYKQFGTIVATMDLNNISISQLNNNNTYFTVSFPKNANTNPGRIQIEYVYVDVRYTPVQEG